MQPVSLDMDAVLSKAASSPDPSVRAMALNYREVEEWLKIMSDFFGIWARGGLPPFSIQTKAAAEVPAPGVVLRSAATTRKPRLNSAQAAESRHSRAGRPKLRDDTPDTVTVNVGNILVAHGGPMKLTPLYEAYCRAHPEDNTSMDNFRQRLIHPRRRKFIALTKDGYWPIDSAPETPFH